MSGAPATLTIDRPRDLVAGGTVCLYWGIGLGTFLSVTDTWFDGVRFYAISPSIVAIALSALGLFCLLGAVSTPKPVTATPPSFRRSALFGTALLLWIFLGASYRFIADFKHLSGQHELALAYRADPGCSANLLSETGKRGPTAITSPGASASSICQLGWTKVTEKTGAGNCLVLSGAAVSGAYCFGGRSRPACDWSDIKVGDAIAAQTVNAHPAAYYCPTKDPVAIPISGRGEVIQTRENPAREFQSMFDDRLLALGVYLVLGIAISYRVVP